jgi:hypothetical protein
VIVSFSGVCRRLQAEIINFLVTQPTANLLMHVVLSSNLFYENFFRNWRNKDVTEINTIRNIIVMILKLCAINTSAKDCHNGNMCEDKQIQLLVLCSYDRASL